MTTLDPNDARRLRSSLALLASSSDGEKLAAVAAAQRILDKAGMGFADLAPDAKPVPIADMSRRHDNSDWRPARPEPASLLRPHQRDSFLLSGCGYPWNDWETDFLRDMRERAGSLSERQEDRLRSLKRKASSWRQRKGSSDVAY